MGGRRTRRIVLTDEQRKLAADNMALVQWVIRRKFGDAMALDDDFVSEGYIGLCEAAHTFKPEMGCKFSSYAYAAISNRIKRILYFESRAKRKPLLPDLSLEEPIKTLDGIRYPGDILESAVYEGSNAYAEKEKQNKLLQMASEIERTAPDIVAVYGDKVRQTEIAKRRRTTPQAANSKLRRTRKKIIKKYGEEYRRIMGYDTDDRRRA